MLLLQHSFSLGGRVTGLYVSAVTTCITRNVGFSWGLRGFFAEQPRRTIICGYMTRGLVLSLLLWNASAAFAQQDAANVGAKLMADSAIKAAVDAIKASESQTIEDQIRLCEVEAPPFKEAKRAEVYAKMFRELGLQNVRIDKEGNVLGDRPGAQPRPRLVFTAHLDTVFPEGTDVKVKREGNILRGPGIGDDCRGLAVLLAVVRTMNQAKIQTPGTITFVGTVGEEGLGDLRGVKYLFNEGMKGQIDRFVSIDGTGLGITHIAVGSLRYRVTFKGPGGHSYGAFGIVESDARARPRHRDHFAVRSARESEDHVQRRPHGRRHVGQRHSIRRVVRDGHALGEPVGAAGARSEVPPRRGRGGQGRGRALEQERAVGRQGARRQSPSRADAREFADRAGRGFGHQDAWFSGHARRRLHRLEHRR